MAPTTPSPGASWSCAAYGVLMALLVGLADRALACRDLLPAGGHTRRRRARSWSSALIADGGRHARHAAGQLLQVHPAQGIGVPHRAHHRHGVLAVRRLVHLLGGVRLSRRPRADRELRAGDEPVAARLHDPRPGHHLHPGLAAGVDRDHRHLHADLPAAAEALQHRSAVLRPAGRAQHPDVVPVPAGGDGALLSQGRGAEPGSTSTTSSAA